LYPAGIPYRQTKIEGAFDAIVIGSGIGGLTTAALLAKHASRRVLVLERHYTAGGFTHAFRRPGFEWDVGLHYVGELRDPASAVSRVFAYLTEGRLPWAPMPEVYDRVLLGRNRYDFPTGAARFREQLKSYFPKEIRAIDGYLSTVNSCARWSGGYFAGKSLPQFLSRSLGGLLRWPFLRHAGRTTADVLREFTSNPELAGVLTAQWGDYGLPPEQSSFGIHAIIVRHYFEGASYPAGGASRIAHSIEPVIRRAGGMIVTSAEVAQILTESGGAIGVRMADGREFRAAIVVSDAGARNTLRMLPPNLPDVATESAALDSLPLSMAHLCLYVGLDRTAAELGLEGTNLWINPGPAHDENLHRFLQDPSQPFPFVYISFPSAKDPEFSGRYPGRGTVELISPANYDWFRPWENDRWRKRGSEYDALKQKFAERFLAVLYAQVPSTRGHVALAELSTPLSTRHFANYPQGEIYGLGPTPARFTLRSLGPRTPVRNLFLTGQDAAVLGVVGAAMGGVLASSVILQKNMLSVVTRKHI